MSFSSSPTRIGRSPFLASVPVPVCCRRHADEPSVESHSTLSYLFHLQGPNAPRSTLQTAVVCPRGVAPPPWPRHGLAMAMPDAQAHGNRPRSPFFQHHNTHTHSHRDTEPCHDLLDMNTAASSQGQLFWAFHRTPCRQPPVQAHAHLARRIWRACYTTITFQLRLDNPALLWPSPRRGGPGTPAFRSRTRTKASLVPRRRRLGPGMPDPVRTRLAAFRPAVQPASPCSATLPDLVHALALPFP